MHCPSCGQEQVSAHTKFCSRCGFPLDTVAELLANGGTLPQLASLVNNKSVFNRKNGVMFAVLWFFLFTFLLTPISAVLGLDEIVPVFGILGIFGSILILITSLVYLPSSKTQFAPGRTVDPESIPAGLYSQPNRQALPPEQFQPANVYTAPQGNWRAPDTGELVTPGTVTENTTKLLSKEENR
jgi:Uncharacterized conserved protein